MFFTLLLLLLSHFSCVRLCATPQTAAHQAPPSLGFSRQEHWSGLPFSSPMHESESEVTQSCPTLRDPMDCSLPQAPPSMGFSMQEYWSGLPLPSPVFYTQIRSDQISRSVVSDSLRLSFIKYFLGTAFSYLSYKAYLS